MKYILLLIIGIGIIMMILIGVLLINKRTVSSFQPSNSRSIIQTSTKPAVPRTLPTENCKQFPLADGCGVVGAPINICSKQYPNYPPLSDILSTKANPNTGIYNGIISKINLSLHAITVISDRSGNAFVFNGGSVNGKLFDVNNTPVTDFYALKTGIKVIVSFDCDQKNGFFTLNRFQMIQ